MRRVLRCENGCRFARLVSDCLGARERRWIQIVPEIEAHRMAAGVHGLREDGSVGRHAVGRVGHARQARVQGDQIGAERLVALIARHGYERFTAACSAVMDYAERLMRQAIAALPDGDYTARTMIDGFVDSPDPQKRHLPIVATVRVRGDEIEVDLTGNGVNHPSDFGHRLYAQVILALLVEPPAQPSAERR